MSEITVDWDACRANALEKATAWPELYIPRLGGTAGDTVDLSPLWDRAVAARTVQYELAPEPSVDMLAEEAGGLALRFRAGLRSLAGRRDGNVYVSDVAEGPAYQEGIEQNSDGAITVTMWSTGGNWSNRAWWAQTRVFVYLDEYGEVQMLAPEAEFIVASGDGKFARGANPFTDVTRFIDQDRRSCILGGRIVAAYRAYLARSVVRSIIASQPTPDVRAVSAQEFLEQILA